MDFDPSAAATEIRKNAGANLGENIGAAVDTARKLRGQAAEVGEQVFDTTVDAGRSAANRIEEKPLLGALATGLLGLAIGVLLGRFSAPKPVAPSR